MGIAFVSSLGHAGGASLTLAARLPLPKSQWVTHFVCHAPVTRALLLSAPSLRRYSVSSFWNKRIG